MRKYINRNCETVWNTTNNIITNKQLIYFYNTNTRHNR